MKTLLSASLMALGLTIGSATFAQDATPAASSAPGMRPAVIAACKNDIAGAKKAEIHAEARRALPVQSENDPSVQVTERDFNIVSVP